MIGRNGDDGLGVTPATHSYEVRPRKDHRGFDLISDAFSRSRHRKQAKTLQSCNDAQLRDKKFQKMLALELISV